MPRQGAAWLSPFTSRLSSSHAHLSILHITLHLNQQAKAGEQQMAPPRHSSSLAFIVLLTFLLSPISSALDHGEIRLVSSDRAVAERKVGGRTEVHDVDSNREVQELGHFCVEEHNRHGGHLTFSHVVAAQRQVVSGIKYFLRIAAQEEGGHGEKMFEAVVVVKAWLRSRELVSFSPATAHR